MARAAARALQAVERLSQCFVEPRQDANCWEKFRISPWLRALRVAPTPITALHSKTRLSPRYLSAAAQWPRAIRSSAPKHSALSPASSTMRSCALSCAHAMPE
jgi:hypothetical protein